MALNELDLQPAKGNSALAQHLNQLLRSPEVKRARLFAKFLDGFHLKDTVTSQVNGRRAVIEGRSVVNFGSANYLGLEQNPKVLEAARLALAEWGNHSGCSRIFSSHSNIIELETKLADLVGSEATIVFPNTSATHQGVIPALFGSESTAIFLDRYAHTSMHQASQIAVAQGAKLKRVDIRNFAELQEKLQSRHEPVKVLMIDGLYSMQGTLADLPALQKLCDQTNTILYVDDAHGIAIYGERGGGVAEHFGLSYENAILIGGLQKGLGAYGGFAAASKAVVDYLRVTSRSYIFSGTLQPQAVAGSLAAIDICTSEEGRALRCRLREVTSKVRLGLMELGVTVAEGDSPIVSVAIGPELRTLLAGRKLFDEGVFVNSVVYPATPRGEGLLRISINAIHSDEEVAILLRAFAALHAYLESFQWLSRTNLGYAQEFATRQFGRKIQSASSWMKSFGI